MVPFVESSVPPPPLLGKARASTIPPPPFDSLPPSQCPPSTAIPPTPLPLPPMTAVWGVGGGRGASDTPIARGEGADDGDDGAVSGRGRFAASGSQAARSDAERASDGGETSTMGTSTTPTSPPPTSHRFPTTTPSHHRAHHQSLLTGPDTLTTTARYHPFLTTVPTTSPFSPLPTPPPPLLGQARPYGRPHRHHCSVRPVHHHCSVRPVHPASLRPPPTLTPPTRTTIQHHHLDCSVQSVHPEPSFRQPPSPAPPTPPSPNTSITRQHYRHHRPVVVVSGSGRATAMRIACGPTTAPPFSPPRPSPFTHPPHSPTQPTLKPVPQPPTG